MTQGGPVSVAGYDSRSGAVRLERHPTITAGLAVVRRKSALPLQPLVTQAVGPASAGSHVGRGERRRGAVVATWIGQPTLTVVHGLGVGQFAAHPGVVLPVRIAPGSHGHRQERLIHGTWAASPKDMCGAGTESDTSPLVSAEPSKYNVLGIARAARKRAL